MDDVDFKEALALTEGQGQAVLMAAFATGPKEEEDLERIYAAVEAMKVDAALLSAIESGQVGLSWSSEASDLVLHAAEHCAEPGALNRAAELFRASPLGLFAR